MVLRVDGWSARSSRRELPGTEGLQLERCDWGHDRQRYGRDDESHVGRAVHRDDQDHRVVVVAIVPQSGDPRGIDAAGMGDRAEREERHHWETGGPTAPTHRRPDTILLKASQPCAPVPLTASKAGCALGTQRIHQGAISTTRRRVTSTRALRRGLDPGEVADHEEHVHEPEGEPRAPTPRSPTPSQTVIAGGSPGS